MASDSFQILSLPMEEAAAWRWRRLTFVVGLAAFAITPGCSLLLHEQQARREASDIFWRLEGPACAPLSAARFHGLERPPSARKYDEVVFLRRSGRMVCTRHTGRVGGVLANYPVCRFDAPDYLAVSVAGRDHFYDLSMGRSATVGVVNGQVRCVETRAKL